MKTNTTKLLCESLKKKMPKLKFEYYNKRNQKRPYVRAAIVSNSTNIEFDVYISMSDKNTFRARYYFGKMKFDPLSLFFVNNFNGKSPYDLKAILSTKDDDRINGDFAIVGSFIAKDEDEASNKFIGITNYLFSDKNKEEFAPLMKLISKQTYKPIEEMN